MLAVADNTRTLRLLLIGACLVVIVAGMRAFADVLNAFFIAALLTMVCVPLQRWLTSRGVSRGASLFLVILLIIVVFVLLVTFITISANQLLNKLPEYQTDLGQIETTIRSELDRLELTQELDEGLEAFNLQSLIPLATGILRAIVGSLGNVLLIFLILFFMLIDAPNVPKRLRAVLGENSIWLVKGELFIRAVQRYVILRLVFGVVIAALQTVMMLILGVDFAIQWGVLGVITNFIPNIGFVIGLIPPVIVTLLEKGIEVTILLVILYSVINNVVENFVQPKFMADELNVSPLVIFLSLIFWAWVLGASGALLAVPLTLMIKIMLLDTDQGARPVAALIEETVPPSPAEPTILEPDEIDENEDEA